MTCIDNFLLNKYDDDDDDDDVNLHSALHCNVF